MARARAHVPATGMASLHATLGFLCLLFLGPAASGVRAASRSLSATINIGDGSYTVSSGDVPLLTDGLVAVRANGAWRVAGVNMTAVDHVTDAGDDPVLGPFSRVSVTWASAGSVCFVTSVRQFKLYDVLAFDQAFPDGITSASVNDTDDVVSAFPAFKTPSSPLRFNFLSFANQFAEPQYGAWGYGGGRTTYQGGSVAGVPLILYDANGTAIVLSPYGNFMSGFQSVSKSLDGAFACGLSGLTSDIPRGFAHTTVLFVGDTVHEAMAAWGSALLRRSGKAPTRPDADVVVSHLGYWTDNGAYYSYQTENSSVSYEETLEDVAAYLRGIGVPVAYVQYDSFWYQKAPAGGMNVWRPRTDYFPDGFNWTLRGMPTVLHANYFDETTEYAARHSMKCENGFCVPLDEGVYLEMMSGARDAWNLAVYEQDWLITTFQGMEFLRSNVTAARTWLVAMGNAAAAMGLTIEYCMATPGQMLQSTEIPQVTHARARHDYRPSLEAWDIGLTSLLVWSVGLFPFKDDFWSSRNETGCRYPSGCLEPNTLLEALISSLSAGPVGPSDKIGSMDRDLVMRACNDDGLLLKPDRPFFPPDASFRSTFSAIHGGGGELSRAMWTIPFHVGTTYSTHGSLVWTYVVATYLDTATVDKLYPPDVDLPSGASMASFDYFAFLDAPAVSVFASDSPLLLNPVPQPAMSAQVPFAYHVIAPPIAFADGTALVVLGEAAKFVTMSAQRFSDFALSDSKVTWAVAGAPLESVDVFYVPDWTPASEGAVATSVTCTLDDTGASRLTCTHLSCACA